jgi:N-acetylmuramoyl-L-alanine amidase
MRIALDIGHMGKKSRPDDRGAANGSYKEADFALDYVTVARKLLEEAGHTTFLLAYDNYGKRHDFCEEIKADLHVQCHINSPDGRYALIECRDDASESCITLTEIMSHQLKRWLGFVISKVDVRKLKGDERGYNCLMKGIPSILYEPLFIRNDNHLRFMLYENGLVMIGNALAEGIIEWSKGNI